MASLGKNSTVIIIYTLFFLVLHISNSQDPTASPSASPSVSPSANPSDSPSAAPTIFESASTYLLICSGSSTPTLNGTIDDRATSAIIEKISIPIRDADAPCYLHISLDEDSNLAFQDAVECSVNFDFKEHLITDTPTSYPTVEPTTNPTKLPTSSPSNPPSATPTTTTNHPSSTPSLPPTVTYAPSTTPSSSPSSSPSTSTDAPATNAPSADPTNAPSSSTIAPTSFPTKAPTSVPTYSPTELLDYIQFVHVFNINDENLFWKHSLSNRSYHLLQFLPSCNESSASNQMFAELDVFLGNNASALWNLIPSNNDSDYQWSSKRTTNPADNLGLFPFSFEVYSNEVNMSTLSVSVMDSTVKCYYNNLLNTSASGTIDYYLFPIDLVSSEMEITSVTMDITINTTCTERITAQPTGTPTDVPTTATPTLAPTVVNVTVIDTNVMSTSATTEDEGWTAKKTEFMIGIGVFALILMIASIVVCVRLKRTKNRITETDEEESSVELKEPNVQRSKFEVTQADHTEMLELARKISESDSTGLR